MINLDKIDSVKFVLIVLVLTFLFCLIMSSQFKAINGRIMELLEYQTKLVGQGYDPKEVKTTSTYTPTTQKSVNTYGY